MDYFSSVLSPNSNFRNSALQILGADSLLSSYSNSKSSPILSRVLGTQKNITRSQEKKNFQCTKSGPMVKTPRFQCMGPGFDLWWED